MAKRKRKAAPARTEAGETFEELVNRLRAAVRGATTWDEFEEARAAVRRALSYPVIVGQTDLWAVCEAKRLTFDAQRKLEGES